MLRQRAPIDERAIDYLPAQNAVNKLEAEVGGAGFSRAAGNAGGNAGGRLEERGRYCFSQRFASLN